MKRIFRVTLFFFFILAAMSVRADILMKVGILDIDQLMQEYPEARELKEKWDKTLIRKYYLLNLFQKEYEYLEKKRESGLGSVQLLEIKKNILKRRIEELDQQRKEELEKLRARKGREMKRKILISIKEVRKKRGYGMIFSSGEKMILYYDPKLNMNPFILEELMPEEKKQTDGGD
jgi:Skp family chaperone for outer membrane proteins